MKINDSKFKSNIYNTLCLVAVASCLGSIALSGCGKAESKTVATDKTNWKGGPMPKDFKANPKIPASAKN